MATVRRRTLSSQWRREAKYYGPTVETRGGSEDRALFTYGWCLWTLSSALSIITSKHILLVNNYHYPLHLLLVYLLVAALGSTCRTVRYSGRPGIAFSAPNWRLIWQSRKYSGPFELLSILCTAISLPLGAQAMTHFRNVDTLAMICMVAIPLEAVYLRILSRSLPSSRPTGVVLLSILAGAALLADEYRLTVNGLLFGITALLFASAAKASAKYSNVRDEGSGSSSGPSATFQFTLSLAFVLTGCWTIRQEGFWGPIINVTKVNPLLFGINIIANAAAIVTGGSVLYRLPVHRPSQGQSIPLRLRTVFELCAMVALTCICSAFSVFSVDRSYNSGLQLLCYVFLVVTAGYTALHALDGIASSPSGFEAHEMLLREDASLDRAPNGSRTKVTSNLKSKVGGPYAANASLFVMGLAAYCLLVWLGVNFGLIGLELSPNPLPHLDTVFKPEEDLDIVVNLYKEPLSHVEHIVDVLKASPMIPKNKYRLILYTKDESANVAVIKQTSGAYNVTKLPNIGREGETYLRHIIEQWDHLATHTVFLQADVHNIREFRPRFHNYFDPMTTGMLSLGFNGIPCDFNDCGDRWGWHDDARLVPSIYQDVYGQKATSSRVLLSYKGQFVASARRIRGVKKAVYEKLWQAFVDPKSWAHQEEFLRGRKETMGAPKLGYAVERLWSILMQCSDLEIGWKCPSLLSQTRRGGSKADCQCFDHVPE